MKYNYDNSWNRMQNFRSRSCDSQNAEEYLRTFHCILDRMIEGMTTAGLTNSISHNFIVQMIPHHRAAIQMCENVLQYTGDDSLRNIACGIISMQTQSIRNMESVLSQCSCITNSGQDLALYKRWFGQITRTMFHQMDTACSDNNISANFIREMIPHHKGAISMCENALRFCVCPGLAPIMESIIYSQTRGVEELEQLLKCVQ